MLLQPYKAEGLSDFWQQIISKAAEFTPRRRSHIPQKHYVHNIPVVHVDGGEGEIRTRHRGSAGASPGH